MLIHFIRHTTPKITSNICYGQADIALAHSFDDETCAILNKTSKTIDNYDVVYSSPLKRCSLLAKKLNVTDIRYRDELKEVNFGDWELKSWNDIPRSESQPWMDDFVNIAPPNGESLISMQQRVNHFLDELLSLQNQKVAVITHAGVLRLTIAKIMNIPLESIFNLTLAYGTVLEVTHTNNVLNIKFI